MQIMIIYRIVVANIELKHLSLESGILKSAASNEKVLMRKKIFDVVDLYQGAVEFLLIQLRDRNYVPEWALIGLGQPWKSVSVWLDGSGCDAGIVIDFVQVFDALDPRRNASFGSYYLARNVCQLTKPLISFPCIAK